MGDSWNKCWPIFQIHKRIGVYITQTNAPHKGTETWRHVALFYQKHWNVVGESITVAVLQVLNIGQFPLGLNHIFITLIPKKNQVFGVADFWPISLCNVLYKLYSKVITNRMKLILPHIISKSQSSFVQEWQITDNILITYEILHFLRRKKKGKMFHVHQIGHE